MPALSHYVGNRSPSLLDTILVDDEAFDLTGSTVKLRMRLETSSTLKVDAAATILTASTTTSGNQTLPISTLTVVSTADFPETGWLLVGTADKVFYDGKADTQFLNCRGGSGSILSGATVALIGEVRYDWASGDVDTAGDYVFWWQVTLPSGKTQDTPEYPITFLGHVPGAVDYVTPEILKATLQLTGVTYIDHDIQAAISAASRGVDERCGRRFYADTVASDRYYTPFRGDLIVIDDIYEFTSLTTDQEGNGTFEQSWTNNTDFILEPLNAAADGWPYSRICLHPLNSIAFPAGIPRSVKVNGKWGWAAIPDQVATATSLLASKILKRSREDPLGAAEALALGGAVVRLTESDPMVATLLGPFVRQKTAQRYW